MAGKMVLEDIQCLTRVHGNGFCGLAHLSPQYVLSCYMYSPCGVHHWSLKFCEGLHHSIFCCDPFWGCYKAPIVDDSILADLMTEQEWVLKNLHDYQLGEDLGKKLQAEQEAEFARQQEELAQKAQAESVASPAAQDWLELMAKIATNSSLFKQLLGDDVNEDNMNERLGMLLMRKRRELAEQSPVKALSIAQLKHEFEYIQRNLEQSNLLNFKRSTFRPKPTLEAPTAKRARQGVPQVPAASSQVPASVPAAPSIAAAVSVFAVSTTTADVSPAPTLPAESVAEVHANESGPDEKPTASEQISTKHTSTAVAFTSGVSHATPSSSCKRHKQLDKKRVTPILDVADNALIKFNNASESDDDPSPYALYAGWEMGDLRVLFQSLADEHAHAFCAPTMACMLRHGLEVPKLLVGGDLTMAKQLVGFIKAALLTAQSAV
nr:hypothetical protein [Tanacetum cinerariifolium]